MCVLHSEGFLLKISYSINYETFTSVWQDDWYLSKSERLLYVWKYWYIVSCLSSWYKNEMRSDWKKQQHYKEVSIYTASRV